MKNYRLKPEAVQFFLEKHATSIYSMEAWKSLGVDIKALEEVEDMYIKYGHKTSETSSTLGGWSEGKGTDFKFTIYFPSTKFKEHDKFTDGRMTRRLMDRIQNQINNFHKEFASNNT